MARHQPVVGHHRGRRTGRAQRVGRSGVQLPSGVADTGAATAYEALSNGSLLVEAYGGIEITLGLVVAFVTAAAAITWMVRWLEQRSLAIFGWYRLVAAASVRCC